MGQEVSRAVFAAPDPPTYNETLPGLFFIDDFAKHIPAVYHEWEGPEGQKPYFTLLYSNSNTADLGMIQSWCKDLRDTLHTNVLCYDYTEYGLNKGGGVASEGAFGEDIRAAFHWLTHTKGIPPDRIVLMGRGMGTGPVVDLAANLAVHGIEGALGHTAKGKKPGSRIGHIGSRLWGRASSEEEDRAGGCQLAGVILQSAPTSLSDLAGPAARVGKGLGPDLFDNVRRIDRFKCPLAIIHPKDDAVIPRAHPEKLAKKGCNVWMDSVVFVDGEHHNVEASHDYLDTLLEFYDYLLPEGNSLKVEIAPMPMQYRVQVPGEQVASLLSGIGLEAYASLFVEAGYLDQNALKILDDIDLQAIGIDDPAHRQAILSRIDQGNGAAAPQPVPIEKPTEAPQNTESKDKRIVSSPPIQQSAEEALEAIGQVRRILAAHAIKWEDLHIVQTLKKGLFEHVHLCEWAGRNVIARNMPSKQHQLDLFCKQAAVLCKLSHPNLVLPLAVCTTPPNLCIVTEYVEGGSLFERLLSGHGVPDGIREVIAIQIAEAMAYLHSQTPSIVHRDLTTRNILLDGFKADGEARASWENVQARVGDFGLSRPPAFGWMAPEIFLRKEYSPASDVFSFGVVLWQLVVGRAPYENMPPATAAYNVAHQHYRLPIPPHAPAAYAELIQHCWAQQPKDRPTFADILIKLRAPVAPNTLHAPPLSASPPPKHHITRTASTALLGPMNFLQDEREKEHNTEGEPDHSSGPTQEKKATALGVIAEMEGLLGEMQAVLHKLMLVKADVFDLDSSLSPTLLSPASHSPLPSPSLSQRP